MAKMIRIDDTNDPVIKMYDKYTENQLFHYNEPDEGLFICESPNVIIRALDAGYEPVSLLCEEKLVYGVLTEVINGFVRSNAEIYCSDEKTMSAIRGYGMTRGSLAIFRRQPLISLDEFLRKTRKIAVLEDVENPTNVGAIFRNAAALGMDGMILTSDSADPLYRRASRVSMGTVFQIPWTVADKNEWYMSGISKLKENGFECIAMALEDNAVPADKLEFRDIQKVAVFLGSEGYGLKKETIKACDRTVIIPMHGGVDSLNVAAASAVVFWEICSRS